MESARHSNANLLQAEGGHKRYYGIAKVLFALNFILFHWSPQHPPQRMPISMSSQPINSSGEVFSASEVCDDAL